MSVAEVGNIELYYEERGGGDPLLLIMGLAMDSTGWLFQVPDFAEHYRTVAFDNRGAGRSSKPAGPYTIAQMAEDTAGLLDAIGIARAHVVGVSMGGMIAQELALRHAARVRGLVLGCTYAKPGADVLQRREGLVTQLGGSLSANGDIQLDLAKIDPMTFFRQLLPLVLTPDFIQRELPKLMQLMSGALQYGFSMEAILAQVAAVMSHDSLDRLPQIKSPTLVITGDADLLVPSMNSDVLAQKIPGAKLIKIAGGSHGFNFEMPDTFNRAVLDFLASVPG